MEQSTTVWYALKMNGRQQKVKHELAGAFAPRPHPKSYQFCDF